MKKNQKVKAGFSVWFCNLNNKFFLLYAFFIIPFILINSAHPFDAKFFALEKGNQWIYKIKKLETPSIIETILVYKIHQTEFGLTYDLRRYSNANWRLDQYVLKNDGMYLAYQEGVENSNQYKLDYNNPLKIIPYPLSTGYKWKTRARLKSNYNFLIDYECEIKDIVSIQTFSGTFNSYEIVLRDYGNDITIIYFTPYIGIVYKIWASEISPKSSTNWELLGYSVKSKTAILDFNWGYLKLFK